MSHEKVNKLDIELSLKVRKSITAQPTRCWYNARRAQRRLKLMRHALYVEGWVVLPVGDGGRHAVKHGWLELPDGRIVDPTLPEGNGVYFAGVRFTYETTPSYWHTPSVGHWCKSTHWHADIPPSFIEATRAAALYAYGDPDIPLG